jgi:hypothetical protein
MDDGRSRVIATRTFRDEAGTLVVATLCEPIMAEVDEWRCDFRISGLSHDIEGHANGVDGMQALTMALEGLRVQLKNAAVTLRWLDGEPGALGLTRPIPDSYGLAIETHLAKLVDDEIARLLEADAKAKGRPLPPPTAG